jgi:hypothetical protein
MNDRGIWTTPEEVATHEFDLPLCNKILELWSNVASVADVGCGKGDYVKTLISKGLRCQGWDGNPMTSEISNGICRVKDFSQEQDIGFHDLVLSLEVGEHIPKQFEGQFITNLTKVSIKWIILSWAIPGQGGVGHCNEQSNMYIISEMETRKFRICPSLSLNLRASSTLPWFKNTLMVFKHE